MKLKYGTDKITGFTLNSSGNVGIGTASPSSKLHLYSAENTTLRIQSDGSGGDQGAICMKKASGNGLVFAVENRDFIWQTGADSLTASGTERMRLTSSGNLSIGGTLSVTGGSIKSSGVGLHIKRTGGSPKIAFYIDETLKGYIGYDDHENPIVHTASGSEQIIIHSGNISSQSVSHASTADKLKNKVKIWG